MRREEYSEVDEVVTFIHKNIDDPLSLSKLASHVSYSPYHFSRIFKERTGLSPLYFVSSLRLQKAKDMLLRTHLSVRDIGFEIGQQSLGTFTTRFTERVGTSPARFRHSVRGAEHDIRILKQLEQWPLNPLLTPNQNANITGTVETTEPFEGVVLIGLFTKPMPEGMPLYGTLIPSGGDFCLSDVRPGTYYLMATSVSWGMRAMDFLLPHKTLRTRSKTPIIVDCHSHVPHQKVTLYPPRLEDPPILISLPFLMNHFLHRTQQHSN